MLIYILRFNLQLVPNHILILYGDKAKGTKMILISFTKKNESVSSTSERVLQLAAQHRAVHESNREGFCSFGICPFVR